jgi:NADH:ubiquinone oxidoreductase subunit K
MLIRLKFIFNPIVLVLIMESWGTYFLILYWLIFILFIIKSDNFINILIYSEAIWVLLYAISVVLGTYNNDINLLSLTFLSLGLAGLEFSLGLILVVCYKNNTGSILIN